MKIRISLLAATLSAVACKDPPKATPEPAASGPQERASSSATPIATAGGLATSTPVDAPSAVASAAQPREAGEAGAPSELHLVLETHSDYTFIGGKGGALLVDEEGWALELRGPTLVQPQGFAAGLASYLGHPGKDGHAGNLESFGGTYPDHIYALIGAYANRGTTDHQVHAYHVGTWSPVLSSGNGIMTQLSAVTPFGSLFAAATISGVAGEVSLQSQRGPDFSPRKPTTRDGATRIRMVSSLLAPPDGSLIAVGADADSGDDAIEVFEPAGPSKAFITLPDLDGTTLAAVSNAEIYLAGVTRDAKPKKAPKPSAAPSASASAPAPTPAVTPHGVPYFAVSRGGAWIADTPPKSGGPITSLDAGKDGTLWATSEGGVWRRPRGGSWISVTLPPAAKATSVAAYSASDVWALHQEKGLLQVFGATAPRWPLVVDAPVGEAPKAVPATATCATPFVLLYSVKPETFGPAYDFPLTRKALAGHTELAGIALVLTEHYQVGAFVPSLDVGDKLAAIIRDKLKGQKPQLVCMAPRVRAEVPLDLATGEVAKGPLEH